VLANPKKKKEIVQYHPPRGKPRWTVVIVRIVKKLLWIPARKLWVPAKKVEKQLGASRSNHEEKRRKEGYTQLCAVETIGNRNRVSTRQPLKERENREIDCGLLKCFPLLQTVFPAVCNRGVEKSVADRANALNEAEQKRGRERKHHHWRRNRSPRVKKAQRDKPKGRGV